ncbi:ATP synthase F(0) complex subunit k, mitochondrial-like [Branchiostoma floridae x Branchiostoma japonicum]
MAGAGGPEPVFTGLKHYFNSYTIFGRKNFVLATYGTIGALFLISKLRKPKQKAVSD